MRAPRLFVFLFALTVAACQPRIAPLVEAPSASNEIAAQQPSPTPLPVPPAFVALPTAPTLSARGEKLIIEQEVDHPYKASYPEAPDCRYSGITQGVGYDDHANSAAVVLNDWSALPASGATRLAATHPFYGCAAQRHLADVRDILISWMNALEVFNRVDVARTWAECQRVFPGFDNLRPNAQAALVSLVFNRGGSMVGPNRLEMRNIRDLVPKQDYSGMAAQFRAMVRIWVGTSIAADMRQRRNAEADLLATP